MIDLLENSKRTHYIEDLHANNEGNKVILMGWVHTRRDMGNIIFINLRDVTGIVQVVFNPDNGMQMHAKAHKLRNEYVVAVEGIISVRPKIQVNTDMEKGDIEIEAKHLKIFNASKELPVQVNEKTLADEDLRLKYRYLDLRRPSLQNKIILRHKVVYEIRKFLTEHRFTEIETPVLMRSTPEGARDYLVPSRIYPGKFFALPQSPQIYKQLLMISGFDRYFQIAHCFRDEDLRADRQPEFTQLDLEMSFVNEEDIFDIVEKMLKPVFKNTIDVDIQIPFPRISYDESMRRFGVDKPDLRFGLEIQDLSEIFADCNFRVFSSVIKNGGVVRALNAKGCGDYSRKEIDHLEKIAKHLGAKGLARMRFVDGELESNITKFFSDELKQQICDSMQVEEGDLILFVADTEKTACKVLGELRNHFGKILNLINEDEFNFVWVVDFPLFDWNEEKSKWETAHHMFCMPKEEHLKYLDDPEKYGDISGQIYDLVCNGVELSSGSIRCHIPEIQRKIFDVIGIKGEELEKRFGFFLKAFDYGTPPHGGIAPGIDRILMLMSKAESIRDVIAFPKTLKAFDLMSQSPSEVDEKSLQELSIKIIESKDENLS
ncbi:MAG: aspartate--tRNA ligase [Candidatus Cloacimonadota bacterium]|nr:aspartate--tRNA ligase [Candidatus Cloacimonadota bacterium]